MITERITIIVHATKIVKKIENINMNYMYSCMENACQFEFSKLRLKEMILSRTDCDCIVSVSHLYFLEYN